MRVILPPSTNLVRRHILHQPLRVIRNSPEVRRLRSPSTRAPQHEAEDADQNCSAVARHREEWTATVPEAARPSVYHVLLQDVPRL